MDATPLEIPDVVLIEPDVFSDERGFFLEAWNRRRFNTAVGEDVKFVQDNHSRSSKGVLRGLHYQVEPQSQAKLVRVTSGSVWDVAVDIRRSSDTFGKWVGIELSDENHRQLWIPSGFAHGFLTLSETADVVYKTSGYYSAEHDRSIRWDDPDIGIDWPVREEPILSDKDADAAALADAQVFS